MERRNALDELREHLSESGNPIILCARFRFSEGAESDEDKKFSLQKGYTSQDYRELEWFLDFEYDPWSEHITGTIWYVDGSWSSRYREYGNSEWWIYNRRPEIPDNLDEWDDSSYEDVYSYYDSSDETDE